MLLDQSLDKYLESLGSAAPTPGGGAAAALTAAQAVALFAMVARLTKPKPGADSPAPAINWQQHISEMDTAKAGFTNLANDDATAFTEVMKCYAMPKGEERTRIMQLALRQALQPPLNTILLSNEILQKAVPYIQSGNKNVITDSGIAVVLLRAAIESSVFNVDINLKYIDDQDFVEATRKKIAPIITGLEGLCKSLVKLVNDRMI